MIAFFALSLAGCATVPNNNYCLRNRYPREFSGKFEKIKVIAMEEAINSGIAPINENTPYIVKPTRYNKWKGEITYERPEMQPFFSIKFDRNRVCFVDTDVANTTDDRPHKAVTTIIDRVQKLR